MARGLDFKILIVYDDFAVTARARELSKQLAGQRNRELRINSWKFDFLGHPRLCQQAASQASEADMIIVSADGGTELPAHVKAWLESWLRQRQDGLATLVALLDQEEGIRGEPPLLGDYLRQMAAKWNVDFYCKAGGWQRQELHDTSENVHHRPQVIPAVVEEVADSAYREWGLNE